MLINRCTPVGVAIHRGAHLMVRRLSGLALLVGILGGGADPVDAQISDTAGEPNELDTLLARALDANPALHAAHARVDAARAAIRPAGALPDPMLGVGITNLPASEPGFDDFMTMKMVGVGQTVPYPGKLALRRRIAEQELAVKEAELEVARLAVIEEVRSGYYELVFLDRAIEIVARNHDVLATLARATEIRYEVGTSGQQDVLMARVELARLAEEAVTLAEQRRATLARLNTAADRPTEASIETPSVPEGIARAAVATDPARIRFTSAALGSRAADSPLPPLAELQQRAVMQNPSIRAHEAMIAAQALRVDLARKEHLPDFELSLQYGQRSGLPDMVSAMISVPIPLRKSQRQDLAVKEAGATLATLQAEHHERANNIRSTVAAAYADLEGQRARLALVVRSILPQGRAALEAATSAFQIGRIDFVTVLESQATLYEYETQYHRALTDFAARLAELERTVGGEILR